MFDTYLVYNTIFVLVVIFSLAVQNTKRTGPEYICRTFLFLSMAIPLCIRKGIGTDYNQYMIIFNSYKYHTDDHEIGFQWIGKTIQNMGLDYQWFVAILAILAIAPICYYIPKKRFSYFMIIYFFVVFLDIMGTSRQDISIALIVCGIIALYHKRGVIKYLGCNAIAILFHSSSYFYLPFVLLRNIKVNTKWIYIFLIITVVLGLKLNITTDIFSNPIFLDSDYGKYAELDQYNTSAHVGSGLGILANILVPLLFLLLFKRTSKHIEHPGFFAIWALVFIFSYILASQIHILGRFMNVFMFIPAFLVYPVCKAISDKRPVVIFIGFVLMYLILFENTITIQQISLGRGMGISPYTTIFD